MPRSENDHPAASVGRIRGQRRTIDPLLTFGGRSSATPKYVRGLAGARPSENKRETLTRVRWSKIAHRRRGIGMEAEIPLKSALRGSELFRGKLALNCAKLRMRNFCGADGGQTPAARG